MKQSYQPSSLLVALGVLGLLGVVATLVASGPQRFFANWLIWFLFLLTVGLGALFIVAMHRENIRRKLGISSVAELSSFAIRNGLF